MPNTPMVAIKGSERAALKGARPIGPTNPHQLIEVSVILKHRQPLPQAMTIGNHMSHGDFRALYGADPAHVDRIKQFAQENKLLLLERGDEALRRTITLAGTVSAMEKAFGIELVDYEHPDGSYRGRTGPIHVPRDCSFVQGVFGLDDRPVAKPQIRYRSTTRSFGARASNNSYNPSQVARLYGFPEDLTGAGQVIGLIELGGGYRPADIQQYFQSQGLQPPSVQTASVDQAKNRPSTAQSADGEVMLDIEVAGSVAPGAQIAVYFAPNTDRGFQDALSMAVHDQLLKPGVISISWGSSESNWTAQSIQNFADVAQEASLLGITVIAASGDQGSSDGVDDGQNHVNFPASCPYVLATGGTRLLSVQGEITSETVWNDGPQGGASGGGYSAAFSRPSYQANIAGQQGAGQQGRGVPDVAGDAAPDTGYNILVDGQQQVVGGTSAVAPLWAGLLALFNQSLQTRVGFINPRLYAAVETQCFNEITTGNNGAFSAGPGWNPACGLGSPKGVQLLQNVFGAPAQQQAQGSRQAQSEREVRTRI